MMSLCSLSNLTIGVYSVQTSVFFVDPQIMSNYLGRFWEEFLTFKNQR